MILFLLSRVSAARRYSGMDTAHFLCSVVKNEIIKWILWMGKSKKSRKEFPPSRDRGQMLYILKKKLQNKNGWWWIGGNDGQYGKIVGEY